MERFELELSPQTTTSIAYEETPIPELNRLSHAVRISPTSRDHAVRFTTKCKQEGLIDHMFEFWKEMVRQHPRLQVPAEQMAESFKARDDFPGLLSFLKDQGFLGPGLLKQQYLAFKNLGMREEARSLLVERLSNNWCYPAPLLGLLDDDPDGEKIEDEGFKIWEALFLTDSVRVGHLFLAENMLEKAVRRGHLSRVQELWSGFLERYKSGPNFPHLQLALCFLEKHEMSEVMRHFKSYLSLAHAQSNHMVRFATRLGIKGYGDFSLRVFSELKGTWDPSGWVKRRFVMGVIDGFVQSGNIEGGLCLVPKFESLAGVRLSNCRPYAETALKICKAKVDAKAEDGEWEFMLKVFSETVAHRGIDMGKAMLDNGAHGSWCYDEVHKAYMTAGRIDEALRFWEELEHRVSQEPEFGSRQLRFNSRYLHHDLPELRYFIAELKFIKLHDQSQREAQYHGHNADTTKDFAVDYWKTAYERNPSRLAHARLKRALRSKADNAVTIQCWTELLRKAQNKGDRKGTKAVSDSLDFALRNDVDAAIRFWKAQYISGYHSALPYLRKAVNSSGRFEDVIKFWQDMLLTTPEDGRIVKVLGQVLKGSRNRHQVMDIWKTILIDGGFSDAVAKQIGNTLKANGGWKAVVEFWESFIRSQNYPRDQQPIWFLSQAYGRYGDVYRAVEFWTEGKRYQDMYSCYNYELRTAKAWKAKIELAISHRPPTPNLNAPA